MKLSFLGDLSQKATDTASKVRDKTNDAQNTKRLNENIANKEAEIRDAVSAIGKAYVDRHRDDPDAEFSSMIQKIKDAENDIASYKKELLFIRRIVVCDGCGAELPLGTSFCSFCGAKIPEIQKEADNAELCANCGMKLAAGARFCTSCGAPVPSSAPVSANASMKEESPASYSIYEETPAPDVGDNKDTLLQETDEKSTDGTELFGDSSTVPVSKTKFCTNCGAKLKEGALFCTECGSKCE